MSPRGNVRRVWTLVRIAPGSPYNLAVFRIAVCAILLTSREWRDATAWCVFPASLRVAPEGLRLAMHILPFDATLARAAQALFIVATSLGVVGLWARTSILLSLIAALYLFALRQVTGSVTHEMHLLWFAAILVASPCGDVLSFDAWRARRTGCPEPGASVAYAWPLAYARILLGLVYLFPALWKVGTSGWSWIASDNLRNQMYWKWFEHDWIPVVRIDRMPGLCRTAAFLVVAFELSFLGLAVVRQTRWIAAALGIAFHLGTEVFMRLGFFSLWGCYVVLFDWAWLDDRTGRGPARVRKVSVQTHVVSGAIILGVVVQGMRGAVEAWPISCYPTFAWVVGTEIPDVVITVTLRDGQVARLPRLAKSQSEWPVAWSLAGRYGRTASPDALRAYWAERAMRDPSTRQIAGTVRGIRFATGWFSVLPEDRGKPALREEPIGIILSSP